MFICFYLVGLSLLCIFVAIILFYTRHQKIVYDLE